jgi:hypothetical protein
MAKYLEALLGLAGVPAFDHRAMMSNLRAKKKIKELRRAGAILMDMILR